MKVTQNELNIALHEAAEHGALTAGKVLLAMGANPNSRNPDDYFQYAPIHHAAEQGNTELCLLLIEHGVDINIRTQRGFTPLKFAVGKGHKNLALLLVTLGADTVCYAHPDKDHVEHEWPFVAERVNFKGMSKQTAIVRLGDMDRLAKFLEDPSQSQDTKALHEMASLAKKLKKPEMTAFIQAHIAKCRMNDIRAQAPKAP